MVAWLAEQVCPSELNEDRQREAVLARCRLGGVLLGVAAAIKLTPLLFVPYLWFIGRRRDALRALATVAACTAVGFVAFPAAAATFWTQAIFTTSRIGGLSSTGNQSLNGVLLRYAVPTAERSIVWAVLAALVCIVAFLCAASITAAGTSPSPRW